MNGKSFADFGIDVPSGQGGEIRVTCPNCSPGRRKHHDRCLAVNVEKGVWHCHHCGWRGGLQDEPAPGYRRPLSYQQQAPRPKAYKKPDYTARTVSEKAMEWFRGRGITEAVVHDNRIGHGTHFLPNAQAEVPCIQFPYLKGGEVVNIKYRDGRKNFCQSKGAEKCFYRFDSAMAAPEGEPLIITEGEMDALSFCTVGYNAAVSVPDGAPPMDARGFATKFDFLIGAEPLFERFKHVILAVDNDAPGKRLEEELARRIGPEKCWRVTYPEGCKDANDVLVKHGPAALGNIVPTSKPYPVSGLFGVSDIRDKALALYREGLRPGVSTGWPALDKLYTVRTREMTIVTGIPGSGKSNWVDALAVNLFNQHGWAFAFCSPESLPLERHMASLIEKFSMQPFDCDGPYTPRLTEEQVCSAMECMNGHFNFILLSDEEMSVDAVLNRIKVAIYRHGIKGAIIDPWNELDHHRPKDLTEHEYISKSLTKIRRFARLHDVHIWIVAHPKKMEKDKTSGKYAVPRLYDISGSATWNDKADNGITVYRNYEETNKNTDICVQKIRFREVGKPGKLSFGYARETGNYTEFPSTLSEI